MSYNNLLLEEGVQSRFLIVIKPLRKIGTLSLHGSGVYKTSFDYGSVSSVYIDGASLSAVSAVPTSNQTYYFDNTNDILYLKDDGTNPSAKFITVEYELYFGDFDAHWYSEPTNINSEIVYFEPYITKTPDIKATLSDNLFGYLVVQKSSVSLSNAEHWAEKHIYDSSFNKKRKSFTNRSSSTNGL